MNWLNYLIQINIYLGLSYLLYALLLRNETYFSWNRIYLLSITALCLLVPFWKMGMVQSWFVTEQVNQVIYSGTIPEFLIKTEAKSFEWNWTTFWITIYFLGFSFGLLRMSISLLKLQQLLRLRLPDGAAFSVFGKIMIDKKLENYETIKNHEEVHSHQFHSFDVFFFEIMGVICWFNPLVSWIRKEIRNIHEFIADEKASDFLGSKKQYATLLVSCHFKVAPNLLVNNFYNQSILKTRIMMLTKQKSNKRALLKYGLALPLFAGMLILSTASSDAKNRSSSFSEILFFDKITKNEGQKEHLKLNQKLNLIKVAGQVLDENGDGLPGANVIVQNTTIGAKTDVDGKFYFENIDSNAKLVISFVGYTTQIIDKPTQNISVKMIPTTVEMEKMVVVGYSKDPNEIKPTVENQSEIFTVVEEMPEFPGGTKELYKFLGENIRYPADAQRANVEGQVLVSFKIDKYGQTSQPKIVKGIGFGCDEEVIRLIYMMPKWSPGKQNGKNVAVMYSIPVQFMLEKK